MRRNYPSKPVMPKTWKCPPGKRLPSFGKEMADAFLRNLMPVNRQAVVHLDHWPPGHNRVGVACLPDAEPEALDWRILAGLDVLVAVPEPCDGDRLRRLLRELLTARPRRLLVVRPVAPHVEFIKTAKGGVEVQP